MSCEAVTTSGDSRTETFDEFERLGFADCLRLDAVNLPLTECDLHDFSVEEGLRLLHGFLKSARRNKIHEMHVVTGKGVHSPAGFSILKLMVERELTDLAIRQEIHSFSRLIQSDKNYGSFIVRI